MCQAISGRDKVMILAGYIEDFDRERRVCTADGKGW
jgi:hypothetical protein